MDTTPVPYQPEVPQRKNNIFPLTVLVVVVASLGLFIIVSVRQRMTPANTSLQRQVTPGPSLTPTLIPHPVLGSMTMQTKDGQLRYQLGRPVSVIIQASSEGKHIVGYDAILKYDNAGFTYESSKSLSSDFQLYSYDRKTYIAFSGIRALQSKALDSWASYQLLEVVMTPKKKGSYVFELSPVGREVSKLVDDKDQIVYPKTMELHLEIY